MTRESVFILKIKHSEGCSIFRSSRVTKIFSCWFCVLYHCQVLLSKTFDKIISSCGLYETMDFVVNCFIRKCHSKRKGKYWHDSLWTVIVYFFDVEYLKNYNWCLPVIFVNDLFGKFNVLNLKLQKRKRYHYCYEKFKFFYQL